MRTAVRCVVSFFGGMCGGGGGVAVVVVVRVFTCNTPIFLNGRLFERVRVMGFHVCLQIEEGNHVARFGLQQNL
jgi:hypothetical protein